MVPWVCCWVSSLPTWLTLTSPPWVRETQGTEQFSTELSASPENFASSLSLMSSQLGFLPKSNLSFLFLESGPTMPPMKFLKALVP